jgi:TRAP-type C4-dicarboxylate transport system permease small subunit
MKGRNAWQFIDFILEKITSWYVIVAEISAAIIMLLSVADVIGAKLFNQGIPSATELIEQLNVPLVFGAVAFVALERGHIRIDSLDASLSSGVKKLLKILSRIVEMVVCGFLTWRTWFLVQYMIVHVSRSDGTWTFYLLPFSMAVFIGFILMTLAAILGIGRELTARQGGISA